MCPNILRQPFFPNGQYNGQRASKLHHITFTCSQCLDGTDLTKMVVWRNLWQRSRNIGEMEWIWPNNSFISVHLKVHINLSLLWSVEKFSWLSSAPACLTLLMDPTDLDQHAPWWWARHWLWLEEFFVSFMDEQVEADNSTAQIKGWQKLDDAQSNRSTSDVVYWIFFETLWEPIKLS